mgnify:CR=1 FL=1
MSTYTAPMKDMQFVLHELAGLDAIARLPGYGDVSTELVDAVLEGAATFSSEVWGPLNKVRDQQGLKRHDDGRVTLRMMGPAPVDIPVSRTSVPKLMEQLGLAVEAPAKP